MLFRSSVGILSTKILTREENLVVIPNNNLINSTVLNHARGGGDGKGRRISLVMDIGVEYDEDISHVKYVILNLMRECPHVLDKPEPRVLLNALNEYSKDFRLYGWVEDYADEFIARDWLLKNIDEQFKAEGIGIPFPTAIEIGVNQAVLPDSPRKRARVHTARLKMIQEEKQLLKEREEAKEDLQILQDRLQNPEISPKERASLEEAASELKQMLGMFEMGDD